MSNQLRGLLEVEQLHFTCVGSSEATRLDNLDNISTTTTTTTNSSNIHVDEIVMSSSTAPIVANVTELNATTDEVCLKIHSHSPKFRI